MKKIPTVFVRDHDGDRKVDTSYVTPGCEWVFCEPVVVTVKWDGTCMRLDETGRWWHRRTVKAGKRWPEGFILEEHDRNTGKLFGWMPPGADVRPWLDEALAHRWFDASATALRRTYELVGPKINGNAHRLTRHVLKRHGDETVAQHIEGVSVADLCRLAAEADEGVVVYEDLNQRPPRMAKLKAADLCEEAA